MSICFAQSGAQGEVPAQPQLLERSGRMGAWGSIGHWCGSWKKCRHVSTVISYRLSFALQERSPSMLVLRSLKWR